MRSFHLSIAFVLVIAACGDDADPATDTTTDTATTETAPPDGTTQAETSEDTATPDTVEASDPDTTTPDTNTPDTTAPEVSDETCGCGGGASCLQAKTAQACITLSASCGGGGLARVDECSADDVMASCERDETINIHYFARIAGWLADAIDECDGGPITTAGTLTVAQIPAGVGDLCSCQRTAAACVQAHGAICDTLACDAGVQTSACTDTDRIPGRCVTKDGQRELVFYSPGATAETAESSCLGASATEYYWFPPGL